MKRKELTDNEKLDVLKRLAQTPRPNQEIVAEETHHGKVKIGRVLREFREMPWEEAKALCNNNQKILTLRHDYLEKMAVEAEELKAKLEKEYEATLKANILQIRHESGLPLTYSYIKDGVSILEF